MSSLLQYGFEDLLPERPMSSSLGISLAPSLESSSEPTHLNTAHHGSQSSSRSIGTLVIEPMEFLDEAPAPHAAVRVCIIGAGIAGLAAGQCLVQHGLKHVKILESRTRLGGRIHTTQINDCNVELGAQFTPYHRSNPILQISQKIKLNVRLYGAIQREDTSSSSSTETAPTTSSDALSTSASETTSQLEANSPSSSHMNGIEPSKSAEKSIAAAPPTPVLKTPFSRSALFKYGAHDYQLTDAEPNPTRSYSSSGVDHPVVVEEGLTKLVSTMAQGLNISLGCAVHSITFNSPQHKEPFFVHFRNDLGQLEVEAFDVVLVTVPLGILKRGDIRFIPALPPTKRDAIAKIAVGHQNKATLVFGNEFWVEKDDGIIYRDDSRGILISSAESTPEVPMLQLFWCGDAAKSMNLLNPKEYLDKLIAKIPSKSSSSSDLKGFQWAPWSHDPHCYGAHSYVPAGEAHTIRELMAEPLFDGHLGFAGEHTATLRPSTVHGAYESGIREARRILESKGGLQFGQIRT